MKSAAAQAAARTALSLVVLLAFVVAPASAVDYFWVAGTGDWVAGGNWDQGLSPEAEFEEVGVINNGGVAVLSTAATDAAGLRLGDSFGESGSLQVVSGGSISFVDSSGEPAGVANIGGFGTGSLEVQGGGSLSTTLLDSNEGSTISVGGGAGSASLTSTGDMFLGGMTTVSGPGHTFSAAGDILLEGSSVYAANLSASTHTALSTPGAITLGGSVEVRFSGGYSGNVGDAWPLFDAGSVQGSLSDVNLAVTPLAGSGERFRLSLEPGGTNGSVVQAVYESALVLSVNAASGAVSLSSPSGAVIDVAGYSVSSPGGSLQPTAWSSLTGQSTPGWDEANPSANSLSELFSDAGNSFSIGVAELSLGAPYVAPAEFGVSPDISFEYVTADNALVPGIIEFVGSRGENNLLLTVNPDTGEASLTNSSNFAISLSGYSVVSPSGSLEASTWDSLEDQNVAGWEEANPSATSVTELLSGAAATIAAGQSFTLGSPFDTALGSQDLQLEFLLDGETAARQGVVVYDTIASPVAGDFNGDGLVNAADYTVFRDTLGSTSDLRADGDGDGVVDIDDYVIWKTNFGPGAGSASSATATPEPTALGIALVLLPAAAGRRRR